MGVECASARLFGMDAKSGGTACFHVLMLDGEAFSFVKK